MLERPICALCRCDTRTTPTPGLVSQLHLTQSESKPYITEPQDPEVIEWHLVPFGFRFPRGIESPRGARLFDAWILGIPLVGYVEGEE